MEIKPMRYLVPEITWFFDEGAKMAFVDPNL